MELRKFLWEFKGFELFPALITEQDMKERTYLERFCSHILEVILEEKHVKILFGRGCGDFMIFGT